MYMLCRTDKTGDDGTDVYVGSTSMPLKEWLRLHRNDARSLKNGGSNNLYKRMKEIGLGSWGIIPLLTFKCDKKTIFEFEKQWVGLIGSGLNINSPITDRKEYQANYYIVDKQMIKEQQAAYNNANKVAKKEYDANYREANRDAILRQCTEYRKNNVDRG